VDSVDAESWYARRKHPVQMAERQEQYERYVLDEVLPLSEHKNGNPFVITTGASFGAYHAVNMALRHPHRFGRVIGLSGMYDIATQTDGFSEGEVYHHNPAHFMQHEHDPWRLDALRKLDIILVTGHDDPMRSNNDYFSGLLWSRGVGHALRLWDGWAHDWPWWRQMIVRYIGGHD
jgi:esterase/lipase superfamily enzyme